MFRVEADSGKFEVSESRNNVSLRVQHFCDGSGSDSSAPEDDL